MQAKIPETATRKEKILFALRAIVFAVLLAARYTEGYGFGLASALLAVLGVNYVFTYPYFDFNFTIPVPVIDDTSLKQDFGEIQP